MKSNDFFGSRDVPFSFQPYTAPFDLFSHVFLPFKTFEKCGMARGGTSGFCQELVCIKSPKDLKSQSYVEPRVRQPGGEKQEKEKKE